MRVASAVAGFLIGCAGVWVVKPTTPNETAASGHYDLSTMPAEYAEKFADPAYIAAFVKEQELRKAFTKERERKLATQERKSLPPNVPEMPFEIALHAPKGSAQWPQLSDPDAQTLLDAHKNDWVILNFWATWCAPCIHELPDMNAASEALADRGVHLIAMNADIMRQDTQDSVEALFRSKSIDRLKSIYATGSDIDAALSAAGISMSDGVAFPYNIIYAPGGEPYAYFEALPLTGDPVWNSKPILDFFDALASSEVL